jgi:Domain of unknown function (DUF4158)
MPSASDSAYPRLKANPSATELGEIYTLNIFELVFAAESTRKPAQQVGLLLLLKTFQRLRLFVRYAEIPAAIISHIAPLCKLPRWRSDPDDIDPKQTTIEAVERIITGMTLTAS